MGVADRQYMQRARPPGGFGHSTVGRLLILCAVAFLLQLALRSALPSVAGWFVLSRDALGHGQLWTLFTYALLHADFQHLFWNGVGIWIFGSLLEGAMPPRDFVRFTFFAAVFSGVAFVVTSGGAVIGVSGVVSAYVVGAALRFPKTPFRFLLLPISIPLWLVTVGYLASDLAGAGQGTGGVAHFAHLGGALYGLVCWKFGVLPSFTLPSLRLGGGGSGAKTKQASQPRRSDAERERVDTLLDKIGREGITSLTDAERAFLNEASKRYR